VQWENLPHGVRKRLVIDLEDGKGKGFSGRSLTSLLNSCELLGYRWKLRPGVRQTILSAFSDICRHDQGNDDFAKHIIFCIRHFSSNEMKWESFPEEAQKRILNFLKRHSSRFNSQDIAKVFLQ
jgi:hypothetical protein